MESLNIPYLSEPHIAAIVEFLLILAAGWVVVKVMSHAILKALQKSMIDEASHILILRLIRIVMMLIIVLTALSRLNISMTPIMTALGTCGVAIALALKDSLGNVAGGILLVMNKSFVSGDEIEINGTVGIVDKIDLMTTHLHTYDNRVVIIPNGSVTTSMIINATRNDLRRVDTEFYVGYDADIEEAKASIRQVIAEGPMLRMEPAPIIGLKAHGDSSLIFNVCVWCRTDDRFAAKAYLEEQVKVKFDEEGITIPYPHMEVRLHSEN